VRQISECVRIVPPSGREAVTVYPNGFTEFAQSAQLNDYLDRIRSSAREVDEAAAAR